MTAFDQLIRRSVNPFDPATFKPGNFWQEIQNPDMEVNSIHQSVLSQIEELVAEVSNGVCRTLLLLGDSGSGKSYLLGRLKRSLNDRAFFAYVGPWADSSYIWRHILRHTVDSLVHAPDGKTDSQLLLWLKSLPSLRERSLVKWVRGERSVFIRDLRQQFPTGITNAKEFFGVLYDLMNPDLYGLACDWLRGDDLDEDDLKALKIKQSVDSEEAAQNLLMNFGRICEATQPLVICFDNLDNIPLLPNGFPDFQALFNVNSTLHNEKLSHLLLLISIITSTWQQHSKQIQPADLVRIDQQQRLRSIDLDQASALWSNRLTPLHQKANPSPPDPIAPLSRDWLEAKFPGGRTQPRNVLMLGQQLIKQFKEAGALPQPGASIEAGKPPPPPPPRSPILEAANFDLTWKKEFQKVRLRLTRLDYFSSPELIWRLREALEALQIEGITVPFLQATKFSAYSLAYQQPVTTGVVWSEDRNMGSFYHLMRACEKAVEGRPNLRLYLIRAAGVGRPDTKGHQIYRQIFAYANYLHVEPDLLSLHYLETYHSLVNAAAGGELVVGRHTPNVAKLQEMVRQSGVLIPCPLLQELEVVPEAEGPDPEVHDPDHLLELQACRSYLLNLMATQGLMGMQVLAEHTLDQFPDLTVDDIDQLIQGLWQENCLQVVDPDASYEARLVYWVEAGSER